MKNGKKIGEIFGYDTPQEEVQAPLFLVHTIQHWGIKEEIKLTIINMAVTTFLNQK